MIKAFFWSRKWAPWAYGGGGVLSLSLYLQVQMMVAINVWYGGFYNLLGRAVTFTLNPGEGIMLFYQKIYGWEYIMNGFRGNPSFAEIAFPYVMLAMATAYLTRRYALWWREAITFNYVPKWKNVNKEIEGASQRIQEDAKRFAVLVESLGLQVMRAFMVLISFLPILWYMSQFIEAPFVDGTTLVFIDTEHLIEPNQIDGVRFIQTLAGIQVTNHHYFPGLLVWIALLTTIGGMAVSWFVGWYLPKLEYNNQVQEAAFRKYLVLGEDDKVNFADIPTITELFTGVKWNCKRLYLHYGYFDIWLNLYSQLMVIVPYLVVGPSLFTGAVLLGILRQSTNVFEKVHASFSLPIDNWTTITELRSIWKRLHEFEANLDRYQVQT